MPERALEDYSPAGIWLGAIIDGEGHISKAGHQVAIYNKDLSILNQTAHCLDDLEIPFNFIDNSDGRGCHKIVVYGKSNFNKLFDSCPIYSKHKSDDLKDMLVDRRTKAYREKVS